MSVAKTRWSNWIPSHGRPCWTDPHDDILDTWDAGILLMSIQPASISFPVPLGVQWKKVSGVDFLNFIDVLKKHAWVAVLLQGEIHPHAGDQLTVPLSVILCCLNEQMRPNPWSDLGCLQKSQFHLRQLLTDIAVFCSKKFARPFLGFLGFWGYLKVVGFFSKAV